MITMPLVIVLPKYSLRLNQTRYGLAHGDELIATGPAKTPFQEFLDNFWAEGKLLKTTKRGLTGQDYGMASKALKRYGPEKMAEFSRIFWRRYRRDAQGNEVEKPLVVMCLKIPEMIRDYGMED
jgi:hypothetical protein